MYEKRAKLASRPTTPDLTTATPHMFAVSMEFLRDAP